MGEGGGLGVTRNPLVRHRGTFECTGVVRGALGEFHVGHPVERGVQLLDATAGFGNLTPDRALATALPTKSPFKKERDECGAPDSVNPPHPTRSPSLPPSSCIARPSTWIGINE